MDGSRKDLSTDDLITVPGWSDYAGVSPDILMKFLLNNMAALIYANRKRMPTGHAIAQVELGLMDRISFLEKEKGKANDEAG